MLLIIFLVTLRILSNSLSGVFQKKLVLSLPTSFINGISYFVLSLFCFLFFFKNLEMNNGIFLVSALVGLFGALGNCFQIKALEEGELSILAPLNSYKIIFSLIFSYFLLKEIPTLSALFGVFLIFLGSFFVFDTVEEKFSFKIFKRKDIIFRFIAVFFTALEAIFIKKLIVLSNPLNALFLWAFWTFLFSFGYYFLSKNIKTKKLKFQKEIILNLLFLSFSMGIMQFSTNILFKMMNVSYALCLFQLSVLLSIFLGYKIFKEKNLLKKLLASFVMILGAILIILHV